MVDHPRITIIKEEEEVLLQFILIPGYPPRSRSYLTWPPFECFSCVIIKKNNAPPPHRKSHTESSSLLCLEQKFNDAH